MAILESRDKGLNYFQSFIKIHYFAFKSSPAGVYKQDIEIIC